MSQDPQSPSDRRDREPDSACPRCGALDCSPNVEAFEEFGEAVCDDCAEALFVADEQAAEDALQADISRMLAEKCDNVRPFRKAGDVVAGIVDGLEPETLDQQGERHGRRNEDQA